MGCSCTSCGDEIEEGMDESAGLCLACYLEHDVGVEDFHTCQHCGEEVELGDFDDCSFCPRCGC